MNFSHRLFLLLILLLPVQLGRHFWPDSSYIFGIRIDYLAPTIYLTDLITVGLLINWFIWLVCSSKKPLKLESHKIKQLLVPAVIVLANLFIADNKPVFLYQLVKLIEFVLLGIFTATQTAYIKKYLWLLVIPLSYTVLISFGQYINQGSLGGLFWWLGERSFNLATPGIAKAVFFGRQGLRPYATFPHPNALAGFILAVLVLLTHKVINEKKSINSNVSFCPHINNCLLWLTMIAGAGVIFLTFSTAAWLTGLLIFTMRLIKKYQNKRGTFFVISLVLLISVFLLNKFPIESFSISRRWQLTKTSWLMIREQPLFGVGLGNFLLKLPSYWQETETIRFIQPVHNIFILILTQLGIFGLAYIFFYLGKLFKTALKQKNYLPIELLFLITLTGSVDHYWLTLQQMQLLSTILIGLSIGLVLERKS